MDNKRIHKIVALKHGNWVVVIGIKHITPKNIKAQPVNHNPYPTARSTTVVCKHSSKYNHMSYV